MDFPDEVDTPFKDARVRFQKYRGIKSMKTCTWDPYENLPHEYNKIWRFENLQGEMKMQKDIVEAEGLPINGTYVTIVLQVDNEHTFNEVKQGQHLILSTLFPHECKITAMHFKLKRTLENNEIVPSKSTMEFSCGFRRLVLRPTFSMELTYNTKNDKTRYMRFFRKDLNVIATAYCPFVSQPCKILAFTKQDGQPVN
jgi:pre-rRNA-processing protein TSR1